MSGCNAKMLNINQYFQSVALRKLLNGPPYVSNHTIHLDLKIPLVYGVATFYNTRFHSQILSLQNPIVRNI